MLGDFEMEGGSAVDEFLQDEETVGRDGEDGLETQGGRGTGHSLEYPDHLAVGRLEDVFQ